MVLTERDFAMLCHLGKHGVSTSSQLTDLFFPSLLMFRKRVRLLIQENLVRAVPLQQLKDLSVQSYRQAASVLGVSTRSMHLVTVYMLADHLRAGICAHSGLTDVKMWKHQYQVARVAEVVGQLLPGATVLNDPEIKREILRYRKIDESVVPDLVFRSDHYNVAVEIERNYKNHSEYRGRFNYYEDSAYSHVLYFCESDELFERISERAATYDKVGVVRILNPDLVFQRARGFVSLRSFLKIKMETHGG
jgi:hypothetical protein